MGGKKLNDVFFSICIDPLFYNSNSKANKKPAALNPTQYLIPLPNVHGALNNLQQRAASLFYIHECYIWHMILKCKRRKKTKNATTFVAGANVLLRFEEFVFYSGTRTRFSSNAKQIGRNKVYVSENCCGNCWK